MHTCCRMESRSIVMMLKQSAPQTSRCQAATPVMIHASLPTLPLMPGTDTLVLRHHLQVGPLC